MGHRRTSGQLVLPIIGGTRSGQLALLATEADYSSLMELPNDLKPVVYRAALRRDVRFRRERFGHKVVFANGRRE